MSEPQRDPVGTGISREIVQAMAAIRLGGTYKLNGLNLTVNGVDFTLNSDEFDAVYDVMDEVDGDEYVLRIP